MPEIRDNILDRVRAHFGEETAEKMQKIAGENEEIWEVWNTGYTNKDYEKDLDHHEEEMEKHEDIFEAKAETRTELLKEAAKKSRLGRRRLEGKAKLLRKQAMRHAKMFMEHLHQYEEKVDDLNAAELERIREGEGAIVQREDAAEGMKEGMRENRGSKESTELKEAEVMRDQTLDENDMGEGLEKEQKAVQQYEKNEIGEEELGMEEELDQMMGESMSQERAERERHTESSEKEVEATEQGSGDIGDDDIDDLIQE